MERLKLAGTASKKRSACLQEEFAASPDDTNAARTSMHCCCEQNTLVFSARLARKVRQTHEKNGA